MKRKKPSLNVVSAAADDDSVKSSSKRKVEFVEEAVEVGTGKKVRLPDGDEHEA